MPKTNIAVYEPPPAHKPKRGRPRLVDLVQEFVDVTHTYLQAKARMDELREKLKGRSGTGHYKGYTVYDVRETTIGEHTRKAYRAVRFTTKG